MRRYRNITVTVLRLRDTYNHGSLHKVDSLADGNKRPIFFNMTRFKSKDLLRSHACTKH